MLRAVILALLLTACRHDTDPPPMHPKEGELPPLPPSSGTPVGYLLDNATQLQLREDQLKQLKEIDESLAARDAEIDTQLRIIEKPQEDPEVPKGTPPPRRNNAPGAQQVKTTADAAKLHSALDVDLGYSPLTNTLPIRRLGLLDAPEGTKRTVDVAWILVPSLEVLDASQTYRVVGDHQIRYSSGNFAAEHTRDE